MGAIITFTIKERGTVLELSPNGQSQKPTAVFSPASLPHPHLRSIFSETFLLAVPSSLPDYHMDEALIHESPACLPLCIL